MDIIVKEFETENHIYLFDSVMRPLQMEIVNKNESVEYVKNLVKKHNISDIKILNQIDFSESSEYIIDRI